MKKLVSLILLISSCAKNPSPTKLQGDFRSNFVNEEFLLFDSNLYWEDVRDASSLWNGKWKNKSYTRNQIAWKIYAISDCLDIDAVIYSSLVFSESKYESSAVSPTGAVGLTQFTTIGIKEVNDQLGRRGASFARSSSSRYFKSILSNCICEQNGIRQYRDLWHFSNQKQRLLENADHALIYGAIYLKSLLSVAKYEFPYHSMRELYFEALVRYNNDPKVRQEYAKTILIRAEEFYSQFL